MFSGGDETQQAGHSGGAIGGSSNIRVEQAKLAENSPLLTFPGSVVYCFRTNECDTYCKEIAQLCVGKSLVVGFDIEWKPTFVKGDYNPTAVIQICTHSICYVFHVSRMQRMPNELSAILKNGRIKKVGVGINGDIKKLRKDFGVNTSNSVDIGKLYDRVNKITTKRPWGLNHLLMLTSGKKMSKSKKTTCSNWERPLNKQQLDYAVLDAYAGLVIHDEISDKQIAKKNQEN